jgi:predicted DNA-binding protein
MLKRKPSRPVVVRLTDEIVERVHNVSRKLELPQSQILRRAVAMGLREFEGVELPSAHFNRNPSAAIK